MVLEQLRDGASRQIYGFDHGTKRLLFILCLPLVDGVFATLLVTGAIETFSDIVAIALTIFTGAGALAVLYSSSGSRKEARRMVRKVTLPLVGGAVVVALIAPVFEQLFFIDRLRYAAGLALFVISLKMFGVDIAEKFSTPGIILTGLVLSLRNPGAVVLSAEYVLPALATVSVALVGLYGASFIDRGRMNLYYIRRGGAAVLGIIALSLFGLNIPSNLGLAVFFLSVMASLR